jgi:DNA-binding transcriptional LysR family regulator
MLELKLVHQAILLAHNRNFIRAAEQLDISQPSLSRNIADLESALKIKLFDRGQDGVTATVFGRLLVTQGEELLARRGQFGAGNQTDAKPGGRRLIHRRGALPAGNINSGPQ